MVLETQRSGRRGVARWRDTPGREVTGRLGGDLDRPEMGDAYSVVFSLVLETRRRSSGSISWGFIQADAADTIPSPLPSTGLRTPGVALYRGSRRASTCTVQPDRTRAVPCRSCVEAWRGARPSPTRSLWRGRTLSHRHEGSRAPITAGMRYRGSRPVQPRVGDLSMKCCHYPAFALGGQRYHVL